MSRNGAGVYTLPASYLAETGDTILADQHNSPLEDLQTDANTPRPIVAGGTGASSAVSARTNLSVMSVADIQSGYVPKVATKAALSALDTASFKAAVLTETTREKLWMWKSGDFSAEEAADTDNVNYIPADGVSTSLGCWVAATGDGVTVRTIAAGGTGADNAADARTNLGLAIGTDVQAHSAVLDATTASYTTAEKTKLAGIETGADVTDATNVNAAGAVMNTDTATTDMQFVGTGPDLSTDPAKLLKRGDAADAIDARVPAPTIADAGKQLTVKADGSGYETGEAVPDGSVTNGKIATPATADNGVDAAKLSFKRSDTGAIWRSVAQVISEAPINVADFGAVGDNSTANDSAFLAAANALGDGGGQIFVPRGRYRFAASGALNLISKINVRIFGEAGNFSPRHYDYMSTLIAKAGHPLIVFDGGQGFECDHLELTYDEPTFGQRLIKLPQVLGDFNTSEVHIHHCRIGGNGQSGSNLIDCYNCYNVVIEKNAFDQGVAAITGADTGQFANSITVRENYFGNAIETGIVAGGHTWRVTGNVHEVRSSDGSVKAFNTTAGLGVQGLVFEGNHLDDGGATGTWVNLYKVIGATVKGNWVKQGLRAFFLDDTSSDIEISGNYLLASESQEPIGNGGASDIVALANHVATESGLNVPNLLTSTIFAGHGMYDNKDGTGIQTY